MSQPHFTPAYKLDPVSIRRLESDANAVRQRPPKAAADDDVVKRTTKKGDEIKSILTANSATSCSAFSPNHSLIHRKGVLVLCVGGFFLSTVVFPFSSRGETRAALPLLLLCGITLGLLLKTHLLWYILGAAVLVDPSKGRTEQEGVNSQYQNAVFFQSMYSRGFSLNHPHILAGGHWLCIHWTYGISGRQSHNTIPYELLPQRTVSCIPRMHPDSSTATRKTLRARKPQVRLGRGGAEQAKFKT